MMIPRAVWSPRSLPGPLGGSLSRAVHSCAVVFLIAACSDSATDPGRGSVPDSAFVVGGDDQFGIVGQSLLAPLEIRVTSADGRRLPGVTVSWSTSAGGGTVSPSTSSTDAQGVAQTTWTLGTGPGVHHAIATVSGLPPVTFAATVAAGVAARVLLSPDSVVLIAGNSRQFDAVVEDEFGNSLTLPVTWTTSDTLVARVDSTGMVTPRLARRALVTARAGGAIASSVVQVVAASASRLAFVEGGPANGRAGTVLTAPITALSTDTFGNGVAGIPILWEITGGGEIKPIGALSDSLGQVDAVLTLGRHAGANGIVVTSPALGSASAALTVVGTPNGTIAGVVTDTTGPGGAATAGTGLISRAPASVAAASAGLTARHPLSGGMGATASSEPRGTTGGLVVRFAPDSAGGALPIGPAMNVAQARSIDASLRSRLTESVIGPSIRVEGVSPALLAARIEVPDARRLDEVRRALESRSDIISVEPEVWFHRLDEPAFAAPIEPHRRFPSDQFFPAQAWHYGLVDAPRAWRLTIGSRDVIVAVLDTGMRFAHPDLLPNLTSDGYDFVSSHTVGICGVDMDNAGDGDGYDADPTDPMDYVCGPEGPVPSRIGGHGVHVAGTIGAVGNNGEGVTGVNWNVRIRPVRVLGLSGSGTSYDLAQGILYAAGLPADDGTGGIVQPSDRAHVINMSLGGSGRSAIVEEAIAAAAGAGAVLVAAAGNSGSSSPIYPAAFPEVISVSAVSPQGLPTVYSNFGSTINIAAPGGDVVLGNPSHRVASTTWDFVDGKPSYAYFVGTSMAAPHVAGIAALLLASNPALGPEQVRSRLLDYAVPRGDRDRLGAGIVNARNSLTRTLGPARALHVRLIDNATGVAVRTLAMPPGPFSFEELPDGEYRVQAGFDEEGDESIGLPGRIWGHYGSARLDKVVIDGAGTYPASFAVGYPTETKPNFTLAQANELPLGGYVRGSLYDGVEAAFFTVRVPAGRYRFETAGWGETACGYAGAADTTLALLNSDGALITENVDVDSAMNRRCSRISADLEAGRYFLRVTSAAGGRFQLGARTNAP
jgi:subtilisin family serine protease